MTRALFLLCVIYASLVMQSNLFSTSNRTALPIWLPGLALAACTVFADSTTSIICASILGLGVDGLDQDQLGIHTILTTLIATFQVVFKGHRNVVGLISTGLTVFVATFCWRLSSGILHGHLDHRSFEMTTGVLLPAIEAATTSLAACLIVLIVSLPRKLSRRPIPKTVSLTNRWSMLNWG